MSETLFRPGGPPDALELTPDPSNLTISSVEKSAIVPDPSRGYHTAPWRKARICARFVLRPELLERERYARIARILVQDETASNRLIGQAVAHLKGRLYQRHRSA